MEKEYIMFTPLSTIDAAINDIYVLREDVPSSADTVINHLLAGQQLQKSHAKLLHKHNTQARKLQEAHKQISRLKETIDLQHESHVTSFLELNAQMDCYRERLGEDLSYN
jgi:hypothetical protein